MDFLKRYRKSHHFVFITRFINHLRSAQLCIRLDNRVWVAYLDKTCKGSLLDHSQYNCSNYVIIILLFLLESTFYKTVLVNCVSSNNNIANNQYREISSSFLLSVPTFKLLEIISLQLTIFLK